MSNYRRKYRSTPKHPQILGADLAKCMVGTFIGWMAILLLWLYTT